MYIVQCNRTSVNAELEHIKLQVPTHQNTYFEPIKRFLHFLRILQFLRSFIEFPRISTNFELFTNFYKVLYFLILRYFYTENGYKNTNYLRK